MYEQVPMYFKTDPAIWNAIAATVTPEQGWQIFMACLNNDFETETGDPVVDALIKFLSFFIGHDMEG